MALKAIAFDDKAILMQILSETDPRRMKALGRQIRGFNQGQWDSLKVAAMKKAVYQKFSSIPELKTLLLQTDDSILGECSPYDAVWGTGTASADPKNWTGENLLGQILMQVRNELR